MNISIKLVRCNTHTHTFYSSIKRPYHHHRQSRFIKAEIKQKKKIFNNNKSDKKNIILICTLENPRNLIHMQTLHTRKMLMLLLLFIHSDQMFRILYIFQLKIKKNLSFFFHCKIQCEI